MKRSTTRLAKRLRARVGAGLIAGSTALALVAVPGGGLAQEEPESEPVEVQKDAVYARSSGEAAPNAVTSEFPPGVVCLVIPPFCGEGAAQITDPINDGLQENDPEDTPDDQSPRQFRAPNTVTVAQNSGEQRYAGGLKFATPEVADGEEIDSATLILHETRPTYHTSSPFFRQMILAALAGIRDQEAAFEEAEKAIMNRDTYPATEADVGNVGVEICPFTEPFDEGTNNWDDTPAFDCIFGANGERVEVEGGFVWEFDLTFTLQAWLDGTLPNEGLYLRATNAPNLAFGDPDTSWQAQISFGSQGHSAPPELALQTVKASSASTFVPPPANDASSSSGSSSGTTSNQGTGFPAPQAFPTGDSSGGGAGAPVQEPAPVTAAPDQQTATQPVAATSQPVTPWWVWLLVPTFLAGMFMTSQSLTTGVEVAAVREGAMSRLIQQRRGGELSTTTPQLQV